MFFNLFGKKDKSAVLETEYKMMRQTVKNEIKRINDFNLIEEKVVIAKKLLAETDVVIAENALCQFDNEQWYNEENLLKKYLEYKKKTSEVYSGVDCDVSLLCVVMYVLLNPNPKMQLDDISFQYGSKKKYEINNAGRRFKGDTLTSALYILKLYLGFLWQRIDNNEQLKNIRKYKEFHGLFQSVARTGVPVSPTGDWNSYCYEHSDVIWNSMDKEAKHFFKCYYMFGNYMYIPGSSYRLSEKLWTSFNMARSNKGKWDTVDTLLLKIYAYFQHNNCAYLSSIFTDKKEELTKETVQWLKEFDDWKDFVEKNCLSAFVDTETSVPISMKKGCRIDIKEISEYDAVPKSYPECLTFFEQVSKRIELRNKDIYVKISKQ